MMMVSLYVSNWELTLHKQTHMHTDLMDKKQFQEIRHVPGLINPIFAAYLIVHIKASLQCEKCVVLLIPTNQTDDVMNSFMHNVLLYCACIIITHK